MHLQKKFCQRKKMLLFIGKKYSNTDLYPIYETFCIHIYIGLKHSTCIVGYTCSETDTDSRSLCILATRRKTCTSRRLNCKIFPEDTELFIHICYV